MASSSRMQVPADSEVEFSSCEDDFGDTSLDEEAKLAKEERGRKRVRHQRLHTKNVRRKLRNQGKQYGRTDVKPAKIFKPVLQCCRRKCWNPVPERSQQEIFTSFWDIGDYNNQNHMLAGLMNKCVPKRTSTSPKTRNRRCTWSYHVDIAGKKQVVCKGFLVSVLCIDPTRLDVLQNKLINGESVCDMRGKHSNRPNKITEDVWDLLRTFCSTIPSKTSHYSRSKSGRKYFSHPDMNIHLLFQLFESYYRVMTGEELNVAFITFQMYFNTHLEYSFRRPRSDVCDFCFKAEQGNLNEEEKVTHPLHLRKVKAYNALKNVLLAPSQANLTIELHYAQNLPLPRIPATEQFYKRLLWLFLCNILVHSSESSYMFYFVEGTCKKGANNISSFIHHVIKIESAGKEKIVIFSDACGGQNRNQTVLRLLVYCAVTMKKTITQVFPVRGHSYCQCDRNFATYSNKLKKTETVEVPDLYVTMVGNAKDPPFDMIKGVVFDYETALKAERNLKFPSKGVQISKAAVIVYEQDGSVRIRQNYGAECVARTYQVVPKGAKLSQLKLKNAALVGVKAAKIKDVKALQCYLSTENRTYYDAYFESVVPTRPNDDASSDDSDSLGLEY